MDDTRLEYSTVFVKREREREITNTNQYSTLVQWHAKRYVSRKVTFRMIGVQLVQDLCDCVVLSHRVDKFDPISVLLVAGPETGKSTISSNTAKVPIMAMVTGVGLRKWIKENPETHTIVLNDMSFLNGLGSRTVILLNSLLNQYMTDSSKAMTTAMPKETETTTPGRCINLIGCIPSQIFRKYRKSWKEDGFQSRLLLFNYDYPEKLTIEIKNGVDAGKMHNMRERAQTEVAVPDKAITVQCSDKIQSMVRELSDRRAELILKEKGIRLLSHYNSLIRSRTLLRIQSRKHLPAVVSMDDLDFLVQIDQHVNPYFSTNLGSEQRLVEGRLPSIDLEVNATFKWKKSEAEIARKRGGVLEAVSQAIKEAIGNAQNKDNKTTTA